jgi:hypothetical protein
MLKTVRLISLVCGALVWTPASAAEKVPDWNWDMRSFCEARVAAGGVDDCVGLQLEARQKVKSLWRKVGKEDREECLSQLENDTERPPSYMALYYCLDSALRHQ